MTGLTTNAESRPAIRIAGVLLSSLIASCAGVDHPPRGTGAAEPGPALAGVPAVTAAPDEPAAPPEAAPSKPARDAPVAGPPKAPPRNAGDAPSASPTAVPAAKAPGASVKAAPAAIPAPLAPPASDVSPPKQPAAPPLDLKALVERLRETKAIGMFTKLALKNQVDDLLDRFREHYASSVKTSITELRPPYDRLLLKVLAAVQDEDPDLARAIVDSREPIWDILADPARFATI
jgi:hypothetical protein